MEQRRHTTTPTKMRRYMAFSTLVCGWMCALARGDIVPEMRWSIVDAGAVSATLDDGQLVELCSLDHVHLRVDMTVAVSALTHFQRDAWRYTDGRASVRVPVEIVRVDEEAGDAHDRVVAVHTITLDVPNQQHEPQQDNGDDDDEPTTLPVSAIHCAFDAAFCVPQIVGIRLPDVVGDTQTLALNHSIVLQFADATNRPSARTRQEMEDFVAFPTYVGDALEGNWTDDRTLVIKVLALDETRVLPLQQLMAALVHTTLRLPERRSLDDVRDQHRVHVHGKLRLRLEPTGDYVVRLLLPVHDDHIASPRVRIRRCVDDDDVEAAPLMVVLDDETVVSTAGSENPTAVPAPTVMIDSVLSHSGHEGFKLHHAAIEMETPGSWSFSFWLFTDQGATGAFRTLFFNGDGTGQHRTPSAWFRPDDRRLVLRVSTVDNMDVGLDSVSEIPRNEWVHIGVTLRNCSTGSNANSTVRPDCSSNEPDDAARPWLYSMKLFVNGALDQEVRIFSPVLPNDGPLHLADGPWTDGVRGFTSHLRVFGRSIRDADHKSMYKRDRALYRSFAGRAACDAFAEYPGRLRSQGGVVPHPAQQIAYWAQCLPLQSEPATDALAVATTTDGEITPPASMYDDAMRLRLLCDQRSWDLLVEAAELGDPRALCDVGTALVYGRLAFTEGDCVTSKLDGVLVGVDHTRARELLLKALERKEWGAARALALIQTHENPHSAQLQAGLYHLAAATGKKDAFMVLGRLYATGHHVPRADTEAAAYHYLYAAADASVAYHARGKQPLHEMNRLYDGIEKEDELRKGQLGDDDELIQYQKMRADKDGDVHAMANMGDLYYWGARGLARDHAQAYRYFQRAAERDHTSAQSAVAGMLLKGEGTKQDNASAIEWYEKAARKNHTRALNGLGFIYFHGSGGMAENKTHALELFERAAANMEDGDSVFNAGYCHGHGLGTVQNVTRAMEYYDAAARTFGHFDAIHELGKLHWTGWDDRRNSSVSRDSAKAITYLKAASEAGTWGATVRTGFEFFLAGQHERATVLYTEATEYGYSVATSNLAYLYDQKLRRTGDTASEARALVHLRRAVERNGDKEVLVRIGDFYYYGWGGLNADASKALKWYSRASAEGVDAGAYNVGHMHEYGLGVPTNYERAERYYKRVLELAPPQAFERHLAIQLALLRLRCRRWMEGSFIHRVLSQRDSVAMTRGEIVRLPSLPGLQEDDAAVGHSMSTIASVALALVVASIGAWLMRRRHHLSA